MIYRLRAFFTPHPVLRALVLALLPLLAFAAVMEYRLSAFVATTTKVRTQQWTEFRPHPTLFWTLRPDLDVDVTVRDLKFHVTTTSEGLRGSQIPVERPENGYRVWCVGDSITYGHGVDDGATYEADLQRLLQAAHPDRDVAVLNGGCPGWSSFQGRQLTTTVGLKYDPELFILGFVYADPSYEDVTDAARVDRSPLVRTAKLLLNRSELYMFLRQKIVQRTNPQGLTPEDYTLATPRVTADEYRANLQWFADVARSRGGHVIYLNLAKRDPDPHQHYAEFREIAKEVADGSGNVFLDVDALFQRQPDPPALFSDRIHPNAAGFQLMAEAIAGVVEEKKWIR